MAEPVEVTAEDLKDIKIRAAMARGVREYRRDRVKPLPQHEKNALFYKIYKRIDKMSIEYPPKRAALPPGILEGSFPQFVLRVTTPNGYGAFDTTMGRLFDLFYRAIMEEETERWEKKHEK